MEWLKIVGVIVVGLFVLDRLGLWLESRGWLYWRKKKPSGGGVGHALQEFEAFLRPSARHVIELKQKDTKAADEQGEGSRVGARKRT